MPNVFRMRKRSVHDGPARKAHGRAIRAIREALGISVSDFAIRCLVSQGYMTNIEIAGRNPAPDVLRKIAEQLGVPLDAISYVCEDCARNNMEAVA